MPKNTAIAYKKDFEAITKRLNTMVKKTYREAYKDADKTKYKTYEEFEKAAKAYNQKTYGTTEPTKVAKEKGISKAELAKSNAAKGEVKDAVKPQEVKKKDPPAAASSSSSSSSSTTEKKPMDKALEAIAAGDKKAAKKSGLKGKLKRVAKRQAGKVKRDNKKAEKAQEATKKSRELDQLRSVATRADDTMAMYFKQKIRYNNSAKDVAIRVAADEKDKKHASAKGKKDLDHDISSMISHANYGKTMSNYGKSMAKMDHGGMAKKMHMKSATTDGGQISAGEPSAPAKQLKHLGSGGSILSKHFKRNR